MITLLLVVVASVAAMLFAIWFWDGEDSPSGRILASVRRLVEADQAEALPQRHPRVWEGEVRPFDDGTYDADELPDHHIRPAWDETEREIFGYNDTQRFIEETQRILNEHEWERKKAEMIPAQQRVLRDGVWYTRQDDGTMKPDRDADVVEVKDWLGNVIRRDYA